MFRKDIENIRKDQRRISKIQSRIKLSTNLLSKSIKEEFSIRWSARFGESPLHLTSTLDSACFTTQWHPSVVLLVEEAECDASLDDVMKLCRTFTYDTGAIVALDYCSKSETIHCVTSDEEEEEMEL